MALQSCQRDQPVECAGVEIVPTELLGQQPADRALAGPTGSVDGDDWHVARRHAPSPLADTSRPTALATSRKFGNDVATSAVLSISIAALALRLATANDI